MDSFFDISFRSAIVYLFMIFAIRIFGKKELSQLSITDLVLILLISNAVQNAMVGPDTSLLGGLFAAATLFILNYLFKLLLYKSNLFSKIVEGDSYMLIYKGDIIERNMNSQRITISELEAVVREHGVAKIQDVELAILEKDGNISVLSMELKGQTVHQRKSEKLHPKYNQ
jgi:uncharacterized membrane protein YcaP (DUF421 family)